MLITVKHAPRDRTETLMKAILKTEASFTLKRGEVTAFPVDVICDKDTGATLSFSGIEDAICLYCEGKDYLGRSFTKSAELKANKEKRLWCLISIPTDKKPEKMNGEMLLKDADGNIIASANIEVTVTDEIADDMQFEDIHSLKRLAWLNSDYAIDHTVPDPYTSVGLNGNRIEILGRSITVDSLGFPAEISTYYTEDIRITDKEKSVLSAPFKFNANGEEFENKSLSIVREDDGVSISSVNQSSHFDMVIDARAEFDGYIGYNVAITAKEDIEVSDIGMQIPVSPDCTKYFMGLGKDGGYFDRDLDFKWSSERHQDNFWVGAVNGGIRVKFTGSNYVKPLVNIYYPQKKMNVPDSWGNGNEGGIRFDESNSVFNAYSGKRSMKKGETLHYNFDIIITPLKPIDLEKSFNTRIFHRPPEAKIDIENRKGARIVNIHHGNDLNPFINYPFFENEALRNFINKAHDDGLLVKVYYTIRELTILMPEFKALRDFDYEIFENGKPVEAQALWQGEAKEWILKTVGNDVIPAWRQELFGDKYKGQFDSSIITNGQSRLCNFYIEGLRYLVEHMEIDGLYIDDLAYDRNTMKRVRKTIDKRPEAYIDFHTWNHYTGRAAYSNSINLYMELLPYIDKAWIGEGFDYDMPKDHWLVAISGIPFGLMSEMMCEGHPHRGLIFGMTTRLGWVPDADPTNIWELFDKYELGKGALYGFWDERNSVKTGNANLVASMYKTNDKTYVVIANWTNTDQEGHIRINGKGASLSAPEIRNFQSAGTYGEYISVPAGTSIFAEVL